MYQGHIQVVGVNLKKKWFSLPKSDLTPILGKTSRAADKAVAMVMKEIPRQPSAEEKPLLTMTSQLVNEQQESRPLLSPSIDDFLCETKSEAKARPVTSNTAVLSPGLDLLDLSEPIAPTQSKGKKTESALKGETSKGQSIKKKVDEAELIKTEAERSTKTVKIPEKSTLDLVHIQTQLEKWGDGCFRGDKSSEGHRSLERKTSSKESSKELLWSADGRSQGDTERERSNVAETEHASDLEIAPAPKPPLLSRESRLGGAYLSRNQSLEEEFERAKAAVETLNFGTRCKLNGKRWQDGIGFLTIQTLQTKLEHLQKQVIISTWITHLKNVQQPLKKALRSSRKVIYLLPFCTWKLPFYKTPMMLRCLQLQPNNLKALMALAVSYTNIGHQQDAYEALKTWIKQNHRYRYLWKKSGSPALSRRMSKSFSECASLEEVKELYLEAAHQNGDLIDPDLQTGLGVLFNLSGEFDRAVDAFNSALMVRPDDYSLWNRLGATLANGDRSEEAVEAYSKALEIQPGFIRSRYNLGISCINLGAHREAVSNFLTALSLQRKSRLQQQSHHHPVISGNIWAALRIALSMMDQPELFHAANVGDLDILLRAFNIES
ncbi:PEX5-related protein isoform X3 [Hyperolius riggenbachi]|uniref:PEX5-related protein isoform X3 n=1 Tax=Hyperolius riggenbachi TaxID=752182 RepID=UPI0035A2D371